MYNNIHNFIEGNFLYYKDMYKDIEPYIKEQALYRAYLCTECLLNGKCVECGCRTPNMFFSPNKQDSKGRWGKMLNPEEWDKFKLDNNISIEDIINKIK